MWHFRKTKLHLAVGKPPPYLKLQSVCQDRSKWGNFHKMYCGIFYFVTISSGFHIGPGGSMSQVVGLPNNSYKPITNTAWVRARLCKLQKGCTRIATASDKVYQLLAHGRWFSPGTPASSATKTGRHDIVEILLKVALNTKNQQPQHDCNHKETLL